MEKRTPHCKPVVVKNHPTPPAGDVYLKLTVIDDVLIVSFKEL